MKSFQRKTYGAIAVTSLLLSLGALGTAAAKFPEGSGYTDPGSYCGYPKAKDSGQVYGTRASNTWARATVQSNCQRDGTLIGVVYGHLAGAEPDFWGRVWSFSQRWYDRGCAECPQYSYSQTQTYVGNYYDDPPERHVNLDADAYVAIYY